MRDPRGILDEYLVNYSRFGIEQVAVEFFDTIKDRGDDARAYYKWLYEREVGNMLVAFKRAGNSSGLVRVETSFNPVSSRVEYEVVF
ncbi:MAG TPA: hypothetical protein VJH95_00715 [Candidatus Nanoarchaeia archaeon]|nr:hypothetical protein [Candidatus Nanoarchaeia archaeon]